MKRSLRITLLSILLSLTLFTVLGVGLSGYLNLRHAADELKDEVLEQSAARVVQRVEEAARVARRQTAISQHLFKNRVVDPTDFEQLGNYWYQVIEADRISGLYLIRPDGTAVIVRRSPQTKRVTIREVRHAPDGKGWQLHTFSAFDFLSASTKAPPFVATRAVGSLAGGHALSAVASLLPWPVDEATRVSPLEADVRTMPSFSTVGKGDDPVWTDSFYFLDEHGVPSYPGLSYATPISGQNGEHIGVMGVNLNVFDLCDYLKTLDDTTKGYAFIVEQRRDGTRKLIGHPDRTVVLQERNIPGELLHSELLELKDIKDPLVPALMSMVPATENPLDRQKVQTLRFNLNGTTYLGGYRGMSREILSPNWFIANVMNEDEVMADAKYHKRNTLYVAAGVLVLAILLSVMTSAQVARPLEELAKESEAIGRLDLEPRPPITSIVTEVERLVVATEDMKTSLRSFRKYVPADLVARLVCSGQEAVLGGEKRQLTIYFSDIANFTNISESMTPEALVDHLGEYLQALSEQILTSGGTVDKYIGDAIMAFWGAPQEMPYHALSACTAALRNQQVLARLREKWKAEGKPLFFARIGINTGEVVVGNIGSAARLNYTVIGDAVNLASRLEGLNKYYGTATLITEATYEEAKMNIVARPLDWVSVKGKKMGVLVYELLALKNEAPSELEQLATHFSEALKTYRRQAWEEASRLFEQILSNRPDDEPAREMLRRCRLYRESPPPADWDGVHRMESK